MPSSLTSIGGSAFYDCNNLTDIYYKGTVDQWLDINFDSSWTPYNTNLNLYFNNELVNDITINKDIPAYAFDDIDSLTKVTIREGVTSIGNNAFYDCSNLTDIYYEGTLEQWLEISFGGSWSAGGNLYINNDLEDEITINKDIPAYAFYNIDSLTKVTIREGVTSIGDVTFYDCDNLTSITLPSSLTSIGKSAFYNCYNLTSITIPEGVTSIGRSAFETCNKLTTVVIESDDIYKVASGSHYTGSLLQYATTVKVLKTIDDGSNTYLSSTGGYTLDSTSDEKYNIYTK